MKAWLIAVTLTILGTLAGCGGGGNGNSNANNLTQAQARQVGTTVSNNVSKDRKSTRLNSSHVKISYAVFCLKKKMQQPRDIRHNKLMSVAREDVRFL